MRQEFVGDLNGQAQITLVLIPHSISSGPSNFGISLGFCPHLMVNQLIVY